MPKRCKRSFHISDLYSKQSTYNLHIGTIFRSSSDHSIKVSVSVPSALGSQMATVQVCIMIKNPKPHLRQSLLKRHKRGLRSLGVWSAGWSYENFPLYYLINLLSKGKSIVHWYEQNRIKDMFLYIAPASLFLSIS